MSRDETHCMALVREAGRDRYLATLYAPENKRGDLFALYAFDAEIDRIRDRVSEPMPGEIRLQWWRDIVEAGGDAGAGHPVAAALLKAIETNRLPKAAFENYLEARIFDLYSDPMPDRTTLEGYCGETVSIIFQLAASILDHEAAKTVSELAGHGGCATGIAALLARLPLDRQRFQCFIPSDILQAAGSSREDMIEARPPARNAVAAMIALAREHLAAFHKDVRSLPVSLRPAFLPLALTPAYLDRLAEAGRDRLTQRSDMSEIRRQWRLFRHARQGWK